MKFLRPISSLDLFCSPQIRGFDLPIRLHGVELIVKVDVIEIDRRELITNGGKYKYS